MNFEEYFDTQKLKPRPQQTEILQALNIVWKNYKYFAIAAPTGVGKTYVALAIADALKQSYLLTGTKNLQEQYIKSSSKVVDLKGRSNYQCNINPLFTVDEAPCLANKELKGSCIRANTCDYYNQKTKALKSQMMITNYAYFLTCTSNADEDTEWLKRESMIMDEAHDLEKHLISMAEVRINLNDLWATFGIGSDEWRFSNDPLENLKLLDLIMKQMEAKIEEMADKIVEIFNEGAIMKKGPKSIPKNVQEKIRKITSKKSVLEGFVSKISIYVDTREFEDSPWVESVNFEDNSIILSPLTAKYLFKLMMEDFAEKFVFISATLPPKNEICKELGIDESEMFYIEVGTPFEPTKSPIILLPVGKMNYKELDSTIPRIVEAIEAILETHKDEKGLIHTGNYRIAKEILDGVDVSTKSRLIARDMGKTKINNANLLKSHYGTDLPTVLLSPSMTTGIDLADDMARFQIIVKLPFASLGDARIKRKAEVFPYWYTSQMFMEILQASGRATRSEEDYSTTYILDSSFLYFYNNAKSKLPGWFKDRLQF